MLVKLANSMKTISADKINDDISKLCTKVIIDYINDLNKKLNPNGDLHISATSDGTAIQVNGSTVTTKSRSYHYPSINVMLDTEFPRYLRISPNREAASDTTEGTLNVCLNRYSYGIDLEHDEAEILFKKVDKEQMKKLDEHLHGTTIMNLATTTPNDRLQAIEDAINSGLQYYHTFQIDHRDTIKPFVDAGTIICAVKYIKEIYTASGPALMVTTDWKKENWNDPSYTEFMAEAGKVKYATSDKTNHFPFFFFRNKFWTIGVHDTPRSLKLYGSDSDNGYKPTSSYRWEKPEQSIANSHQNTFIMFDSTERIKMLCKSKTLRRYGLN